MKFNEWRNEAAKLIHEELLKCYSNKNLGGWDENYITTQMLIALKSLGLELAWDDKPQKVKWECHKLKSHLENQYGDIAVIVKVWLTPECFVEGVAFYEAKRQYLNDTHQPQGFNAIKLEQLLRISELTHASHILLYDVDLHKKQSAASTISTIIAKELCQNKMINAVGRIIHRYGEPWVVSLGNNLLGLHLDFCEDSVKSIKELNFSSTPPAFILNSAVGLNNLLEPKLDNTFINNNIYENSFQIQEPQQAMDRDNDIDGPEFDR